MAINTDRHPDAAKIKQKVAIHSLFGRDLSELKLCHSPLRHDEDASFSVFYSNRHGHELAKDFSDGTMYDVVKIYAAIMGVTYDAACRALADWDGQPIADITPGVNAGKNHKNGAGNGKPKVDPNIGARSVKPAEDSNYLVRNHLTIPLWVIEDLDAFQDKNGNLCFHSVLGDGSIHVKGNLVTKPNGKKSTYTTWIGPDGGSYSACGNAQSNEAWIFEGIGDFLAYIQDDPDFYQVYLFYILNTNSNAQTLIDGFQGRPGIRTNVCLDFDDSGNKTTLKIVEGLQARGFTDTEDVRSHVIDGDVKDVLDMYHNWLHEPPTIAGAAESAESPPF